MGRKRRVPLLFAIAAPLFVWGCRHRESTPEGDGAAPLADSAQVPLGATRGAAVGTPTEVDARFAGHLVALAFDTRVHEKPSDASRLLGSLRAGAVVSAAPSPITGCWYAIAPNGYVCVGPENATTDVNHELARALAHRPDVADRLPYMYGVVRGAGPIYARLPTREEALAAEPELDAHMRQWLQAPAGANFRTDYWRRGKPGETPSPLALWDAKTTSEIPPFLDGSRTPPGDLSGLAHAGTLVVGQTKNHNGLALIDTAVAEGRRYGITTDLLVFPVDRMRPIEGSAYHGFAIPTDIDFPFAIIRRDGAEAFSDSGGKLVKSGDVARRTVVKLTGRKRFFGRRLYFEIADGLYISDAYASFVDRVKKLPKWAKGTTAHWIDVSINRQTLVAYEGEKAVYATVVSTGEAGLEDPATSKSTKLGIFRIHTKYLTTTMESKVVGEEFEIRDIPYVQYFEAGYALHAAYWHDDFGIPRSHGCINLSPEDARWLFNWTEPSLPTGWHSVRKALTGSVVFVHP